PVEIRELRRAVRRAELGDPGPADRELVEPQHVHDADRRQGRAEQLGALRDCRAYQQAPVRAAPDRELRRRRITLRDEILRGGHEIVEYVLLLLVHSRRVPRFPGLTASPQVRHGVYTAQLEPREPARRADRRETDLEPALGSRLGRIRA